MIYELGHVSRRERRREAEDAEESADAKFDLANKEAGRQKEDGSKVLVSGSTDLR
jgi:hypothetical protein